MESFFNFIFSSVHIFLCSVWLIDCRSGEPKQDNCVMNQKLMRMRPLRLVDLVCSVQRSITLLHTLFTHSCLNQKPQMSALPFTLNAHMYLGEWYNSFKSVLKTFDICSLRTNFTKVTKTKTEKYQCWQLKWVTKCKLMSINGDDSLRFLLYWKLLRQYEHFNKQANYNNNYWKSQWNGYQRL